MVEVNYHILEQTKQTRTLLFCAETFDNSKSIFDFFFQLERLVILFLFFEWDDCFRKGAKKPLTRAISSFPIQTFFSDTW